MLPFVLKPDDSVFGCVHSKVGRNNFIIYVLYLSISFGDFLLLLRTSVHKYLQFLLLTWEKHAPYFCV